MKRPINGKLFKYSEALILVFIWMVIFIGPVVISKNDNYFDWNQAVSASMKLFPFFILSIINHFVLVPYLFFRKKYYYFLTALPLLIVFTYIFSFLQRNEDILERPLFDLVEKENNIETPPFDFPEKENNRERPPFDFAEKDNNMERPPFDQEPHPRESRHGAPFHTPEEIDDFSDSENSLRPLPPGQKPGELPLFFSSIIIGLLILGFDTGILTIFKWTYSEREREKLEKEKVKSELAFLRNQVSPHFFMNTLNNIHALIDMDTEEAKEAIIRLSKLMRHLLYDSSKDSINLEEEIGFIQSYVELMKLRYTEKVKVKLFINTIAPSIKIPPLLFTALIENAFKYGVSYQNESFIYITLSTIENQLIFIIQNSISYAKRDENKKTSTGIGLENTKKRLNIIYKDQYEMKIDENNDIFTVSLKLPI
jgi:two-component sensor histidine kinase